jgi:predicted Zn-dependent protease
MLLSRPVRRGLAFLLGLTLTLGVGIFTPEQAKALPWQQLILNGIQLLQLNTLSPQQRVQLGEGIHQQVASNYRFNPNPQTNALVNRIGQRLVAASDCSQYPFRFSVVQDNQINAFATTGGFVYVHTGTIRAADTEDQLASVIGHEIGHICNDDLIKRLRKTSLAQGALTAAGVDRNALVGIAYKLAVQLPNNRQDEFNADTKGLQYLTRAGYDPRAMPAFLSKLLQYSSPPTFLSDHPGTRDRITALEQKINQGTY